MAGNDFSAFLSLIGSVVLWLLKRTVDLIGLVFLVASCVFPWRLLENLLAFDFSDDIWQLRAFAAFVLTVADAILVPLTLVSLLSPFRWPRIYWAFKRYNKESLWDFRFDISPGIFHVILDILCCLFFIMQHLFPSRTLLIYKELARHSRAAQNHNYLFDYYGSERTESALFVIYHSIHAFLDALCFLLGAGAATATPSIWMGTAVGLRRYVMALQTVVRTHEHCSTPWDDSECEDAFHNLRMLMLSRVPCMLIDWCCYPLGIFALLSPFRHVPFRSVMSQHGVKVCGVGLAREEGEPQGGNPEGEASFAFILIVAYFILHHKEEGMLINFDFELRCMCAYYGLTAVVDVLLFPIFLPLIITWYRYHPVRNELFGPDKATSMKLWGFREYGIISRQFSFLVLDAIMSPLYAVVFITRFRLLPVDIAIAADDRCSKLSLLVHLEVIRAFCLLLLDIAFLPLTLLVLLTFYRREPLLVIWQSKSLRHGMNNSALWLHFAVLLNCALLLHDIILVPFLFLVLLFTAIRARAAIRIVKHVSATSYCCRNTAGGECAPNETGRESLETVPTIEDVEQIITITPVTPDEINAQAAPSTAVEAVPNLLPTSVWRGKIWAEFFNVFFDAPFVVLAVVVYGTLWRAKHLHARIAEIERDIQDDDVRQFCCDNDDDDDCCCCCCGGYCSCCNSFSRRNWSLRWACFEQFLMLLRDIVVLVPLSVVVITLYRFPNLILDLVSKAAVISRHEPSFRASEVTMECPESGPIGINILCSPIAKVRQSNSFDGASKPYTSPVKLYCCGDEFWNSVESSFGASVARIGQSMLPRKLREGLSIGEGVVEVLNVEIDVEDRPPSALSCPDGPIFQIKLQLDVGNAKRSTILKKLKRLDQNARLLVQLEAGGRVPSSLSPVVIAVTPQIDNLVEIFELKRAEFPKAACDEDGVMREDIFHHSKASSGVVDEFWVIVLMAFSAVILDVFHLILALFVLLLPWRFLQLVVALCETEDCAAWRVAQDCYAQFCDARECLAEYKAGIAPLMNALSKSAAEDHSPRRYKRVLYSDRSAVTGRLDGLEDRTWRPYKRAMTQVLKRGGKHAKLQEFIDLLASVKEAEDLTLQLWAFRTVFNTLSHEETQDIERFANRPHADDGDMSDILVQVVEAVHRRTNAQLHDKQVLIDKCMREMREGVQRGSLVSSLKRLWRRSTGDMRSIIRQQATHALQDLAYAAILLIVILSVVRTLPLMLELYSSGSRRLSSPSSRRILKKHLKGAGQDLRRTGTFVFYASCVFLLCLGVPSFLQELPSRLRSLEDATNCAKEHLQDTLRYLCELLCLFTAWKSYKLVLTSCLYAVLLPPACLAEAVPRALSSVLGRFWIGLVVWVGVVAGAVAVSVTISSSSSAEEARAAFLLLYGSLIAIVCLAALSLQKRDIFRSPIVDSCTGFLSLSWSHIFSLLLGPLECLQLSSLILYFYWSSADSASQTSFMFPVIFTFDSPGEDSGLSFTASMTAATCCASIWVVLVSFPLAFDSESEEGKKKIRAVQRNPLFDALHVLLSRILFVSIAASLMRPFSCVNDQQSQRLVLSTAQSEACGSEESFQNGSFPSVLLLFFAITTTDSPDMLNTHEFVTNGESEESVRFAPLYSLVIHIGQLGICFLCFGFASSPESDRRRALGAVAVVAAALAGWSALYPWRGCSLACVGPTRAAGFASVLWTAVVCLDSQLRSRTVLLSVGASLLAVGYLVGCRVQMTTAEAWRGFLQEAGLGEALTAITSLSETLLVEEALGGSPGGCRQRALAFRRQMEQCRGAPSLGLLLVRFEEQVLAERLHEDFLCSREEWRGLLLGRQFVGEPAGPGVSYGAVMQGAETLRHAIRRRSPLAVVNKHIVAMVFVNHLPEYVAWEVFSFMYDVKPLAAALIPLLEEPLPVHCCYCCSTHAHSLLTSASVAVQQWRDKMRLQQSR